MAAAATKTRCNVCGKDRATFRCAGCLKEFCHKHLGDHRQELNQQLDEIEVNRDLFRQSLTEQVEKPNNHRMIQQIARWERDSIRKIQQTAEEARKIVKVHVNTDIHQLETKLAKLTDQLRESRDEDDFNEINLRKFQEELERLSDQLVKPSNISIREDSTPFISKILVEVSDRQITPIVIGEHPELYTTKG